MTRWPRALAVLCAGLWLACGKYGPPLRASEQQQPETKRSFEIPLPSTVEPAPAAEPAPPSEQEPPPEGAP